MTRTARLGELLAKKSRGIVPANTPDSVFELYSVPSFEARMPEIVNGGEIGSNKQIVVPGTVLLCKINPRINRAWVVGSFSQNEKIASTEWITFPPHNDVEPKYLSNFLSQEFIRQFLAANASGVGGSLTRVKASTVEDIEVTLPPVEEQRRIVAEVEKQFSRLDEAIAGLQRVKANLKRYKAAVLKSAVAGRLVETEADLARREGRSYETGAQLLQRILETRRSQWQGKGKYKEPAAPDTADLPELPEGWVWIGLEQVAQPDKHALKAGPFGSALKKEHYASSGYKIYGQEQVIRGDHRFGDYYIDEAKFRELESCAVKPGDLLISLVGTAGKVLVLPTNVEPGIINPRVLKLSLNGDFIAPAYAAYMLQSVWSAQFFKSQAHGGTMEILNLGIIKALPVPLPPLPEQHRIVAEVDRLLSIAREAEAEVEANLKRAQGLRQSILSKSFGGPLQ